MLLPNIRLDIEYDGEGYVGWQRQDPKPTIQGVLEQQLEKILGRRVILYGASRTDSGVHARCQVANFYAGPTNIPPEKWKFVLNTQLPHDIRIVRSFEVPEKFNAQKSARGKIYSYRILNRGFSSALDRRCYFIPFPVNWDRVEEVLPLFVGEKDYRSFQSGPTQVKSTVRKIQRFQLFREGNGIFRFEVEGNGFLKQMVRNMIGTVLEVGQGVRDPARLSEVFLAKARSEAGRTVPARGLTLMKVFYADDERNA